MNQTNSETTSSLESASIVTLNGIGKLKPPFELQALPYPTGSLKRAIDQMTMEIHHGKHHQTYVDNLNKLVEAGESDLETILSNTKNFEPGVRNNAGGHWNHTFFWTLLSGDSEKQKMPERLSREIIKDFGSIQNFKEAFERAGATQFGSGWCWLIRDNSGKLAITTTSNQDNPIMDSMSVKGRPIFTVDVWEHAYYLSYKNERAQYLKSMWQIINWMQVDAYDREVTAH